MRIRCSQCQAELNAKPRETAFKVRCPKCGHVLTVPSAAVAPPDKLPASPPASTPTRKTPSRPQPPPTPAAITAKAKPAHSSSPRKIKTRHFSLLRTLIALGIALFLLGIASAGWYLMQPKPIDVVAMMPVSPVPAAGEEDDDPPAKPYRPTRPAPKTTPKNDPIKDAAKKNPVKAAPRVKGPAFKLQRVETAAVIDRSGTPAGTLFESRMLTDGRLKWVERAALDQIFAEQNLQAIFSPDGVGSRVALGKVIKADILAVVRQSQSPDKKKLLDMVVFEIRSGLRLATRAIPADEDAAAAADQFVDAFQHGIAQLDADIVDVCAVPPFLSKDLVYQHGHMTGSLARSLEGHLSHRKGLLLVELAEAQSLAKEASLAGSTVNRPLPLVALGEYRNEGLDKERRLSLTLRLKRGERELAEVSRNGVMPDAASATLKDLGDELLAKGLVKAEAVEADPESDIAQLTSRGATLTHFGQWLDSAALMEAAIAIDPSDANLRHLAANAYGAFVQDNWRQAREDKAVAIQSLQAYRRAMEHIDVACRPSGPPAGAIVRPGLRSVEVLWPSNTVRSASFLLKDMGAQFPDEKYREFYMEVKDQDRQIMLTFCRLRAKYGYNDENSALYWAVGATPPRQRIEVIRGMMEEHKALPYAADRIATYARLPYNWTEGKNDQLMHDSSFLAELMGHKEAVYREAGEILRKVRERNEATALKKKLKEEQANAELDKLSSPPVEEVKILVSTGGASPRTPLYALHNTVPLADGSDLLVGAGGIYLMKEKGVADLVWKRGDKDGNPRPVVFDGRYVWFVLEQPRVSPRLMILDLTDKSLREVTAADGLPTADPESQPIQHLLVAPLEPGKVFLVGSFGRSWMAIATHDPAKGSKVSVFHEARAAATPENIKEWDNTSFAFKPLAAHVLTAPKDSPDAGKKRIIVPREMLIAMSHDYLLLIDPDAKTVSVLPEKVSNNNLARGFASDGALYFAQGRGSEPTYLVRLEYPGRLVSTGIKVPAVCRVAIGGDDVFVYDDALWQVGSLSQKTLQPRARLTFLAVGQHDVSNHFGLLGCGSLPPTPPRRDSDPMIYRLTMNPNPPVTIPKTSP